MTKVREFHEAFGLPVSERPRIPSVKEINLRAKLIKEEYKEAMYALRVAHYHSNDELGALVDLAKELADLRYVVEGTAETFGIPLDEVYEIVHQSNMSKLGSDGKPIHREDGKVLKGPDYFPAEPKIRELLAKCHQS